MSQLSRGLGRGEKARRSRSRSLTLRNEKAGGKVKIIIEEKEGMNFEEFGGVKIYRPKSSSEIVMRYAAQKHLFSKFRPGNYEDAKAINEILQHQFSFYFEKLNQYIQVIAQEDFLHFLLFQYDESAKIDNLYKARALSSSEESNWAAVGPIFRRTIKYLAERSTLLNGDKAHTNSQKPSLEGLDILWISAEEAVKLYLLSDQIYTIFPNSSRLELIDRDIHDFLILSLTDTCNLDDAIRTDAEYRDRYVGDPSKSVVLNLNEHQNLLGDAFLSTVGLNYLHTIGTIHKLIEGCAPAADGLPAIFVHKQNSIEALVKATGASPAALDNAISGFLITKEKMEEEGREVWKPKQEYRAYRRAFFEVWHETGPHIAFSRSMAQECLLQLISESVFKKVPPEWASEEVSKAGDALSNRAGSWFESVVYQNLARVGIVGLKSQKKGFGVGPSRLEIPGDVGEIDFIGYSNVEELLVLIECKLVRGVTEPKFFRDDIYDFVTKQKSYLTKFNKKAQWIKDNLSEVQKALASDPAFPDDMEISEFKTAIITHYPSIVQCVIKDHPCVSITNFMLDYEKAQSWPY